MNPSILALYKAPAVRQGKHVYPLFHSAIPQNPVACNSSVDVHKRPGNKSFGTRPQRMTVAWEPHASCPKTHVTRSLLARLARRKRRFSYASLGCRTFKSVHGRMSSMFASKRVDISYSYIRKCIPRIVQKWTVTLMSYYYFSFIRWQGKHCLSYLPWPHSSDVKTCVKLRLSRSIWWWSAFY